jgi:hypothetical protein
MIYMTNTTIDANGAPTIELAVLETPHSVASYEAQGYVRCSYETFREAWRQKHTRTFERLHSSALGVPQSVQPVGIYAA